MNNYEKMKQYYSDMAFWEKIKKYSKKIGHSIVYMGLLLYFVLQKPDVPMKAKAIIIGALGYFIFPIDLIPDALPGIGYSDDLVALGGALVQIAMYIDADVKKQAKDKLKVWFGDNVDTSEIDEKIDK